MSNSIYPENFDGNIMTSRVRIARNFWGYPFKINDAATSQKVVSKVCDALNRCDEFDVFYLSDKTDIQLEAMKEKHLISQALIDNKQFGAVLISKDESVSVMVNEEDIIRQQCFMKGLRVFEAYKKLDRIDDELSKNFNFAYDDDWGYLTACPTNVGTGLRASVMLFLPALTISGKIERIIERETAAGLTVRGAYGEGSAAEGYVYQLSNEITLGIGEQDILKTVEEATLKVCEEERKELDRLVEKQELLMMDKAKKSYGVLTNAVMLGYEEFLGHIGNVKLGAMLGMLNINDLSEIDDLTTSVRPALLGAKRKSHATYGQDVYRAELVKNRLKKLEE